MELLILLGEKEEYLDCMKFDTEDELTAFVESIEKLLEANIKKEMPLKERIKLSPVYFPYVGAVTSFEVISPDEMEFIKV